MKKVFFLVFFAGLLLTGCKPGQGPDYDRGYEDAWDGRKDYVAYFTNAKYKEGYTDGREVIDEAHKVQKSMKRAAEKYDEFAKDVQETFDEIWKEE